ncbi:MAG: hypothetical protein M1817_005741 [Caeruleum heppii]|nr:MAG: hypothetical protein M1817_005741 [Caeruleum heppii]
MAIQGRRSGTRGFSRTAVGAYSPSLPSPGLANRQDQTNNSVFRTAAEKKYTKDHEWIEVSSDGKIGTIGITTYAAHSLGDVVYVELPSSLPLKVSAGDAIGAVESVKSASDIMSPVSGTVVEANSTLEEKPAEINRAPEGDGWVARVELGAEGKGDLDGLMGEKEYKAFTEE